jgi:hypothetical protein
MRVSVFDDVPDPNPFDADIAVRPAAFVLRPERSDRYIIGFIALFWLVFGPLFTMLIVAVLLVSFDLTDYLRPVLIASAAAAFVVYIFWWWPEFRASFRVVNVTISDEGVDVHERDLIRNRAWSQPLSGFQGVGLVSLGTQLVGFSKKPMAAVMLVHPDPSRSIPLSIAGTNLLGRQNVGQKARQLGLPVLPGVAAGKDGKVYPAEAIVVNRYQALKMRLIQAAFALALLFFAYGSIRQFGTPDADLAWPSLAVILVPVVIAMQIYARQYVIDLQEKNGEIAMRTGALVSPWRRFPRASIRELEYKEGRMNTGRHFVHAPYTKMRVKGYTWPFVVDMQSDFVDVARLRGLAMTARQAKPAKTGRRRR